MELFDLFVCKWDNFKFIFWIKRDWGKKNREKKIIRIELFKFICIVKWLKMVFMLCRVRYIIIFWIFYFIEIFFGFLYVGYI